MLAQTIAQRTISKSTGRASGLLSLPMPYPRQSEILTSPARFKLVACGRQVGKTFTAALSAVGGADRGGRGLLDGAAVHISSTSQNQSDMFWDYLRNWLSPLFNVPGFRKNESRRIIDYKGGRIQVKTGSDPDSLRGGTIDKLILDECAYLDPRAFQEVGLPMLAVRNGIAELYSTPLRRNWFFKLFVDAANKPDWQTWNFSSHENPYLTDDAMRMLTDNMTDEGYQQEILAQFLESQGAVFRRINEVCTEPYRAPFAGHDIKFVFGVDWAQSRDYTVIMVMDVTNRRVVHMDRFNGVDWALQRGRLKALYDQWRPLVIVAESNSVGGPNIEALQREGLPVRAFETTASSKPPLIESLVLAFERGELTALDDDILRGELMAYERTITSTGRSQYSAPAGMHDDTVMALALAWHGVMSAPVGLGQVYTW